MHKKEHYMEATVLNQAQLDLLRTMSYIRTPESLNELRKVIKSYFAKKTKESIDHMWETGKLNEEKFESFKTLHERTPYDR